jgi:phage terminase large subunit
MQLQTTVIYEKNAAAWVDKKRRALNEGGTASSKTYSILQLLILIAQHAKSRLLISIVSESLPHLKRGCIRDFKVILGDAFDDDRYNKSEQTYSFGNGLIEFFPADEPSKMRGGRRDILFINEANNVSYEAYRELDIRTRLFTILDWNPVSEFWAHENLLNKPENEYIHSTYQDAIGVLPQEVVDNIESNKEDANWWNVYGLGRIGKIEGLVYPRFDQVEELPQGNTVYGLDFGFSGDPAALVKNIITPQEIYSDEIFYMTGLTNQDISVKMEDAGMRKGYDLIFADSAEPKSIEELHRMGWNIKPVVKQKDSVEYGHQKVGQHKLYWTKRSLNCIKEQRNFRYIADKNGKLTEKTTHLFSHGQDARRYALIGEIKPFLIG